VGGRIAAFFVNLWRCVSLCGFTKVLQCAIAKMFLAKKNLKNVGG